MNPFLGPRRIVDLGRRTVEGVVEAPDRVSALWAELTAVVRRASRLLDRADLIAARMEHEMEQLNWVTSQSQRLLSDSQEVADAAGDTTAAVRATREMAQEQVARLRRMLDLYQPLVESLAPLGEEAARALRPTHLRGLVALLDELPRLVDRIEPALDGMGGMVPEMREVTDRMENMGQVVEGLPGAKILRRRGQAREDQEDLG